VNTAPPRAVDGPSIITEVAATGEVTPSDGRWRPVSRPLRSSRGAAPEIAGQVIGGSTVPRQTRRRPTQHERPDQ
jgi:hypothetical protein